MAGKPRFRHRWPHHKAEGRPARAPDGTCRCGGRLAPAHCPYRFRFCTSRRARDELWSCSSGSACILHHRMRIPHPWAHSAEKAGSRPVRPPWTARLLLSGGLRCTPSLTPRGGRRRFRGLRAPGLRGAVLAGRADRLRRRPGRHVHRRPREAGDFVRENAVADDAVEKRLDVVASAAPCQDIDLVLITHTGLQEETTRTSARER